MTPILRLGQLKMPCRRARIVVLAIALNEDPPLSTLSLQGIDTVASLERYFRKQLGLYFVYASALLDIWRGPQPQGQKRKLDEAQPVETDTEEQSVATSTGTEEQGVGTETRDDKPRTQADRAAQEIVRR